MEIRKRFVKNIVVLYVSGEININSAEFIEETGSIIREGIGKILCNFANVELLDYNGLSILAIAYKNVTNQGGLLKFTNVPAHVKELFRITRLEGTFDMYEDEKIALKSFDSSDKIDKLTLRRRFKRIDLASSIRYKKGLSSEEKLARGKVTNLSGNGLFIHSKETFPVATEICMEITLGDARKPALLSGTVLWLADRTLQPHAYPGMGVGFTNLETETQQKIINFIDKNLTQRSKA